MLAGPRCSSPETLVRVWEIACPTVVEFPFPDEPSDFGCCEVPRVPCLLSGPSPDELSTVTVVLIDEVPTEAVTVYEPVASLPSLSEVLTRPSLSVVAVVTLNDTVPSSGLTLNVTVCPSTGLPSSVTLRVNGNEPPGWPGQGLVVIMRTNPDGGEVPTVAVPLTDSPLIDAEIVYEPVASLPSVSVVCARPLLPVVALVGLSDAVPSSGLTLNVTV